jgi:hypothetical protein
VDYPRSDTGFWNSYVKYTPQYAKELGLPLKTTSSQTRLLLTVLTFEPIRLSAKKWPAVSGRECLINGGSVDHGDAK